MATQFFGQWLMEKGLVRNDALLEALDYQQQTNLPLGALAVEKQYLSAAQAKSINTEQQRTDRRFGEIAVDKGLLTDAQVDEILQAQRERRVMLGEVLVTKGFLTRDDLERELRAYQQAQREHEAAVHLGLEGVPHPEVVRPFLDTTLKLFQRVAHETVKITGVSERTPALLNGARHFAQQVKGDASFFYGLSLPESLTLSVASRILGSDQEKVNELVVDAASEYVNIIVGNACVQLSMNNLRVSAEPPVQVPGTSSFPSCTQRLCVELESTRAPFSVQFLFIG